MACRWRALTKIDDDDVDIPLAESFQTLRQDLKWRPWIARGVGGLWTRSVDYLHKVARKNWMRMAEDGAQ